MCFREWPAADVLEPGEDTLYLIIDAVHRFRETPEFADFITVIKRAGNITEGYDGGEVDPSLFREREESSLWEAYGALTAEILRAREKRAYSDLFTRYASLSGPLAKFFDAVLVECDDEALRNNRISLLIHISRLIGDLIDFGKIT